MHYVESGQIASRSCWLAAAAPTMWAGTGEMFHVLYRRESPQDPSTGTFTIYRAYPFGMEEDYEMHSMKRQVLLTRDAMVVAAAGLVLGVATFAYGGDGTSTNAVRHVRGRTVFSEESPKVELSVRKGYRFIGTQQVNLYGVCRGGTVCICKAGPRQYCRELLLDPV